MRRFFTILFACVLGLAAAFAFAFVADMLRRCTGEQLSCSMTKIIGFVYTPVFSVIALVAFAIAIFWKDTIHALNVAAMIPLGAFLIFAVYVKWSEFSVREFHDIRERDIQELLQIIIPIVIALIVPWLVLLRMTTSGRVGKETI